MKKNIAVCSIMFVLLVSISACAQVDYRDRYRDQNTNQDSRYDQNSPEYLVEFFEHSDYRGNSTAYELNRDQRHVLIEFVGWDMNDRISSIRLGRNVGVALFRDREFNGPVVIYEYDAPRLDMDVNDWASSAIIFDLESGGPLGVWIGNDDNPSNIFSTNFRGTVKFYPLSEDINDAETGYRRLDAMNDNAEWVVLGPANRSMFRNSGRGGYRRNSSRSSGFEVEVALYEHADMRGRSIMLPSRYGRGQNFDLKNENFNRMASSMVIREIRPRW